MINEWSNDLSEDVACAGKTKRQDAKNVEFGGGITKTPRKSEKLLMWSKNIYVVITGFEVECEVVLVAI